MSAFLVYISHEYRKRYIGAREREFNYTRNSKEPSVKCLRRKKSIKDNLNNGGEIL
jgi:hypothetical protein